MSEVSSREELVALRDLPLDGLPREALIASIHDLAAQLLRSHSTVARLTLCVYGEQIDGGQMKAALDELSVLGDEDWKTPGHPMNDWVSKATVQRIAKRGLGG